MADGGYLTPEGEFDVKAAKAAIAVREARIAALEAKRKSFKNFRYVLDMELPAIVSTATPAVDPAKYPFVETAINVAKGTIFYVKEIDAVYSVVGEDLVSGAQVTMVIPPPRREQLFTAEYRLRDTGSDRFWDGDWMPIAALLSANRNGLCVGRGHAVCSGGAQIVIQVRSQLTATDANLETFTGLSTISKSLLKFTFIGVEVKA